MSVETFIKFTAFVLGFIAVVLAGSAGVALLRTVFTIAPGRIPKLKARALKHLVVAVLAGAASAAIAMAMQ